MNITLITTIYNVTHETSFLLSICNISNQHVRRYPRFMTNAVPNDTNHTATYPFMIHSGTIKYCIKTYISPPRDNYISTTYYKKVKVKLYVL